MALSPRCGEAMRVFWNAPPTPSSLRAVNNYAWNLLVRRLSSSVARAQFPPDRWLLSAATDCRFNPPGYAVRSPSIGRRWSSSWPFVLRPRCSVLSDRCRAHPMLTPSRQFIGWIPVDHIAYSIVPFRCSELSSVAAASPHAPSFTAPPCSASGHSLGNVCDVVPARPSSVETALCQSYVSGFCLDRAKIRDSSTPVLWTLP